MRLKQAELALQELDGFDSPKLEYEQYATSAHLAAVMFHTADETFDDVRGRTVLDLGVGTGMLSAGALLYGAEFVLGVDVDPDAIAAARANMARLAASDVLETDGAFELVHGDVLQVAAELRRHAFDTIVMNPPFGTKTTKGIDMRFLELAIALRPAVVYSLHKSSTRAHVLRKAAAWGYEGSVVAELRWDLKATYKFHKKKSVDIEVDFLRFVPT